VLPAIGMTALPGTKKESGRSGGVCTGVGCLVPRRPFRQGQLRATNKILTLSRAPSP
jgi:hypothetical protein